MSITDQLLPALQTYREVQVKLHQEALPAPENTQAFKGGASIGSLAGLAGGSLLVGMAEDGLPTLLDLYDPSAGPLLVTGDRGCGKTALLQSLARASDLQDPGDISFCVLTPYPEEWTALEAMSSCQGIWPAYHPSAIEFMSQLVGQAESLAETRQMVLLLIDGFDLMTASTLPIQRDLRWLLTFGPVRHVWPAISMNPGSLTLLQSWWGYFNTCIIGQVKEADFILSTVEDSQFILDDLYAGKQFSLFRNGIWSKFCLPPRSTAE